MKVESVKHFKKLVADFRMLTTKVQKDYQIKSKNLKETNQVLETCKKNIENTILNMKLYEKSSGRIAQMPKTIIKLASI